MHIKTIYMLTSSKIRTDCISVKVSLHKQVHREHLKASNLPSLLYLLLTMMLLTHFHNSFRNIVSYTSASKTLITRHYFFEFFNKQIYKKLWSRH